RESAERILVASEKAKQSAYLTNKGESGMLAIVHSDDYIADFLPDLLYQFSLRYPNVYLDFYQGITTGFPERINRGEVDCAFSTLPLPAAAADYEILPLSPTAIVAVVPDNHPLSKRKKVTLEETINECLFQITGTKTAAFGVKLEQLQVKAGIQIKSRFATDGSQVEMEMVRRGYGITFTTETSVPTGMKGITVLKLDDPDAYLERALVWRKDNTNPALKRFIEVMQEHLELPSH
ncbi:MAG: LysR family transcriptional regulator substrate-binding protein, partial [Kordiimonadaceae bacterium]|nr:LysR family transcriptional regulator substrate-binding protein [Kordiimonadaceae bacterium]